MKVNKNSVTSYYITILTLLLCIINETHNGRPTLSLRLTSIYAVILFLYIIISWKRTYFRIISPSFVFEICLFLTLCGQCFMWSIGGLSGYRDLTTATYGSLRFTDAEIVRAILFSLLCIMVFHSTILSTVKNKKTGGRENIKNNEIVIYKLDKSIYKIIVSFGTVIILLTIVPYIITFVNKYTIIRVSGYGSQYENITYGISSVTTKISEFFPVGLLTMLYVWLKKNPYNTKYFIFKRIFVVGLFALYIFTQLLLSQRTAMILFCIAFLFILFKDKEIDKKYFFFGAIGLLLGMILLRSIDMIRSGSLTSFSQLIEYTMDSDNNPVLDFLGDIGWNLMTTIEFQNVIPAIKDFGFGFSYLISLTSIIPNLNFWPIHPAYEYGNISGWLQSYLGFSFGIGCTPVAEAFYNFGLAGALVFVVWGLFLKGLNKKFESDRLIDNYQVVLFMGMLVKSATRSSMFAVFRPYIFYVWFPAFFITVCYRARRRI